MVLVRSLVEDFVTRGKAELMSSVDQASPDLVTFCMPAIVMTELDEMLRPWQM
jgi:hypothetical protein